MSRPVIIFTFAGREPNMRLQEPFIRRILEDHSEVSWDIWDLARDPVDSAYLRTIEGERITVRTQFAGDEPWRRFDDVYRFYADEKYRDHVFVKGDDDLVFIETKRFADFISAVQPNMVLSAKVVNNGSSTPLEPGLNRVFRDLHMPLLDVHLKSKFAVRCHHYFFDHVEKMLEQPIAMHPIRDWLSINWIAYDWRMACKFASLLGTPSPGHIAGRVFTRRAKLGDEGMVNTLPRTIFQGMTVCHLSFGPQERNYPQSGWDELRARYAEIGQEYLA